MQFKDLIFVDVEFEDLRFGNCGFRRLGWEGVSLERVMFEGVGVQDWNCAFIRGSMRVSATTVGIWRCEGRGPYYDADGMARPAAPLQIDARGLDVAVLIDIYGALSVTKGTITGSTVTLDAGNAQRQDLGRISFKRSRVSCRGCHAANQIDVSKASFESCELRNVPLSYDALNSLRRSRRLDGCTGVLLVFGVPANDKTFVIAEEDNGQEVSVRHWWTIDSKLLLVDWNLFRQRADSVEVLDQMLNQLGKTERAILQDAIEAPAAA
jgi:uncharacterized protein YjbI with pentapeptide repeats